MLDFRIIMDTKWEFGHHVTQFISGNAKPLNKFSCGGSKFQLNCSGCSAWSTADCNTCKTEETAENVSMDFGVYEEERRGFRELVERK